MIYTNAGHFLGGKGAVIGQYREGDVAMKIRDKLKELLPNAQYVPDELSLRESIDWINERCKPDDIGIGIHLNSNADKRIRGVECYYYKNYKLAKNLSANVAKELGIPNRGAKPDTQSYVGSLGFVRQLKCNSVILECAYLSNMFDLDIITKEHGKENVAKGIYNTVEVSDVEELKKEITALRELINILLNFITKLVSKK